MLGNIFNLATNFIHTALTPVLPSGYARNSNLENVAHDKPASPSGYVPPTTMMMGWHEIQIWKTTPFPVRSTSTSAKRSAPLSPWAFRLARKQATVADVPRPSGVPVELGEYIACDARLLRSLGWHGLVAHCRPLSNFSLLDNVLHPAFHLLCHYKHRGAPVKFSTPPWTRLQVQRTLSRGPHKSAHKYIDYLEEEFVDMINKGQWVVLPYSVVCHLPGLRISPPESFRSAIDGHGGLLITAGGM